MNKKLLNKSLLSWLLFIPLPVINGFLREGFYMQYIGPRMSEIVGTIYICVAFIAVQYLLNRKTFKYLDKNTTLQIGTLWAFLTILFELVLGLFILNTPLEQLTGAYNIAAGRIWIFVILTIFFTPFIINALTGRQHVHSHTR